MLTSIFNFARNPTVIISLVVLILGRYFFVHERISPNSIANLNTTVGGRLQTASPLALPCFSSYNGHAVTPDLQTCQAVQANYHSHSFRARTYGSTSSVGCFFPIAVLALTPVQGCLGIVFEQRRKMLARFQESRESCGAQWHRV